LNPALFGWLTKLLWTSTPTHEVLGLPKPISARVLAALDEQHDGQNEAIVEQIQVEAQQVFAGALRERGVPQDVYRLVISVGFEEHLVQRQLDGCTWSLFEFDDFIDLGMHSRGR
jgi:hypothetical protein